MGIDGFDTLLGGWQLGKQIGSGVNGRVYSLKDKENEKKSVLKIIKLSKDKILETKDKSCEELFTYSDDEYCDAFIKNITDNIDLLKSYDSGKRFADYLEWKHGDKDENSVTLLIRMEKLTPLSDFLGEYAFTEKEVLRMAACLCDSLDKCRDFGFIYPNLKPDNVMFDAMGRCKLGDLGVFCCIQPVKTSIAYKKTQQYMAPEFYKTDIINETCDTYSLGLVMYALLNKGRTPFLPTFPAEITMNELSKALKLRVEGKALPPPAVASEDVKAVVMKAISYDIKNRYKTPRQMLNDIRRLLNGEPVTFEDEEEAAPTVEEPVKNNYSASEYTSIDTETIIDKYDDVYSSYSENERNSENTEKKTTVGKITGIKAKDNSDKNIFKANQRLVLALLIIALVGLIITVIVLGIKYAAVEQSTLYIYSRNDKIIQFYHLLNTSEVI